MVTRPAGPIIKPMEAEPPLYYPDVLFIKGVDNDPISDEEPTIQGEEPSQLNLFLGTRGPRLTSP